MTTPAMLGEIDVTFDFRKDTPAGRDPDAFSPTLRRYHRLLWSKSLPSGRQFLLDDRTPYAYLHHGSALGEFFLASDSVIPCFGRERRLSELIGQIPKDEWEAFNGITYTIGGMMVFPGNRIGQKMTINGARGFHPKIKDRFDLTVECIRRHYCHEGSPLDETLSRYKNFFDLFDSFQGYVEYFLLQDLVKSDLSCRFFLPFDDFSGTPLPRTADEFREYRQIATEFVEARNRRISNGRE